MGIIMPNEYALQLPALYPFVMKWASLHSLLSHENIFITKKVGALLSPDS
jgi:hypothetical protein